MLQCVPFWGTVSRMGLALSELKDLITFGRELGLQALRAEGVEILYSPPIQSPQAQPADEHTSGIPSELMHYSAQGKAVFGKRT